MRVIMVSKHNILLQTITLLVLGVVFTSCSYIETSGRNTQPRVVMQTELGKIVLQIDVENAPITARNFMRYVDEGWML